MRTWIGVALAATVFAGGMFSAAVADDEAANSPYLASGARDPAIRGDCYVVARPDDDYEQTGTTEIYLYPTPSFSKARPRMRYDWYSQRVYVDCGFSRQGKQGISVVRMGPWARGHLANERQLAIAFYLDGRMLARYSTLDIAGAPDNVLRSKSHYEVFGQVPGWVDGNRSFVVITVDGRKLSFDPATGKPID